MREKPRVLIVDDVELNRAFLSDILKDDYQISEACDGIEALEQIADLKDRLSIVLLDIIMPGKDGFEVLEEMKKSGWLERIPVVLISAENSAEYISRAYGMGAADYISRPFDSGIIKKRVENTISLHMRHQEMKKYVLDRMQRRDRAEGELIDLLSTLVEFRSQEPEHHIKQVRELTKLLLETLVEKFPKYKLEPIRIGMISRAAALHDVGKAFISLEILNKPGRLEAEEYEQVKQHAAAGASMLEKLEKSKLIEYAIDICRYHHERFDGSGYPAGLKGKAIPLCAQVVGLADAYDVLVNRRVYKKAYTHEQAVEMLLAGEFGAFNPDLLACLTAKSEKIKQCAASAGAASPVRRKGEPQSLEDIFLAHGGGVSSRTLFLLEQERIKYQFLASLSNEVLFEYDAQEDTLVFSGRAHEEMDLPVMLKNVSKNKAAVKLLSERDIQDIGERILASTPEAPILKEQYLVMQKDGTKQWNEFSMRTMWGDGLVPSLTGVIGKMTNIHASKLEEARLTNLAERDPLTGLYNQAAARRKVEALLSRKPDRPAAFLFFDFDNFKTINDTLGHAFGDRILCHISDTILKNVSYGDIAARVGGDEFIVFMRDVSDKRQIEQRTRQLFESLCGTYEQCVFSVSTGVAVYPDDGDSFASLYEAADRALYVSKGLGKRQYTFFQNK